MHLTAPVYQLKRSAKRLAREAGIPLHAALNRIAAEEGFQSWSHLALFSQTASPATKVLSRLDPGDLVLLAARPGHGKTCLSIELIAQAARTGRRGFFFTLDYNERDVEHCLERVGLNPSEVRQTLVVERPDKYPNPL